MCRYFAVGFSVSSSIVAASASDVAGVRGIVAGASTRAGRRNTTSPVIIMTATAAAAMPTQLRERRFGFSVNSCARNRASRTSSAGRTEYSSARSSSSRSRMAELQFLQLGAQSVQAGPGGAGVQVERLGRLLHGQTGERHEQPQVAVGRG